MKTAAFSSTRWLVAGLTLVLFGAFALSAWAHGAGRHGGYDADHGGRGMISQRMIERLLDHADASPPQREQIRQIGQAAASDLKAQVAAGRALREQAMALFTQPEVDATAAEALRQQMLAQHDQASRRAMRAMLDISQVLTPEQRKLLAERMSKRRDMMLRHWRERNEMEGTPAR